MDFVNPWLLGGMAVAAVPIVLHLVMRPRPKQLEFPALRFLRERREANRRRLRLRQLLLLALRVGAIVLLALALARPTIRAGGALGGREAPVAAVMIFDTAPHMQYQQQNQTRLDVARETALWLIDQLPDESEVAVLETRGAVPVFQIDLGAARDRIERLETAATSRPLAEALEAAAELLSETDKTHKEVYVFTDLSESAWTAPSTRRLEERLAALTGTAFYVIDVGVEDARNFGLGALELSAEILPRGSRLLVAADVSSYGAAGTRDVELYLRNRQGELEKRSYETVELGQNDSQRRQFVVGGLEEGTHQGLVRIVGDDGLSADDVRYFTVEVKRPWRVLVVAPPPAAEHALFLTEALAPSEFRKIGQSRFHCDTIATGELRKQNLDDYAAVCLVDPEPLPAGDWQRLTAFVADGGGLAVFLGRHAANVDAFNSDNAQELLPAPVLRQARREEGDVYLAPDRLDHPLWTRFRPLAGAVPWEQFPVFRYWQLGDLTGDAAVIGRYSDRGAALVERPVGRGRVLVMTTPVSDLPSAGEPWNLLPTGFEPWPFVMLVNEAMLYLVGSADEQLNYVPGQMASLKLGEARELANYVLTTPDGELVRRNVDRTRDAITVPLTDQPGHYRVQAGGDEGLDRGFSVNLSAAATNLSRIEPEQLGQVFGDIDFRLARGRDEIEREVTTGRVGRELFGLVIVVVALLLAMEHLLANRFYRQGTAEATRRGAPAKTLAAMKAAARTESSEKPGTAEKVGV